MAFQIPSLRDLSNGFRNAFRQRLPGTDAYVEPNNLSIAADVFSLGTFELYQRLRWLSRQLFASTADAEHLERHAFEFGLTRKPASPAVGKIAIGQKVRKPEVIPAGVRFIRADGVSYVTVAPGTFVNGSTTVGVRAETAGQSTNLSGLSRLTLDPNSTQDNLNPAATVTTAGLSGGADVEDDESLRDRVLFRKRNPPHGGAVADYVAWAREVPGCTRAFAASFVPVSGAVTVYPLFHGLFPNGIPDANSVALVQAHLNRKRPVTARVYAVAPKAVPVNVRIDNLSPDNAQTREAVQDEIREVFAERAVVILAGSSSTFFRSWISEAVSRATGESAHSLVLPAADVTLNAGEIAVPGTITFI